MPEGNARSAGVDGGFVQNLAASNGLTLSPHRAADLVPAVQAILDADAQLADLDLGSLPVTGLPWAAWQGDEFNGD